ncbi:hypothetical protein GCM10022199_20330 [Marihabitans asiaticum]|uniref:Uncharacterized protein n=1 Tax=Marihabitans asiaticum TaxID=415218 RepID=A0A560WB06_9MICO|nr:hypothetical protein [Marihabitans asiaticum]TWD14710.1 hypothetical protein FB557_2134 [Marihabitans asiaticum]
MDAAPSEDAFRALARSSPWRWSSVRLTWHDPLGDDVGDAQAWIRDRSLLRVEYAGEVQVGRHEPAVAMRYALDGDRTGGEPVHLPRLREIDPVLGEDGLVLLRPDRDDVEDADPFWQTYLWLALLDPVEVADGDSSRDPVTGEERPLAEGEQVPGTRITELRAAQRRGRETWWARVTPTWAYAPRCGCCPLLWGEVSEWFEGEAGGPVADRRDYPESYEVALDVQTGICVQARPVGSAPAFAGHDVTIHEVDVAYPDELFTRSGRLRRLLSGRGR